MRPGSSTTTASADSLWSGLQDSSSWGLDARVTPKGASKSTLRQLTLAAYENFYGAIEEFDKQCTTPEVGLNKASGHGSLKELQAVLGALRPVYLKAAKLYLLLVQTTAMALARVQSLGGTLEAPERDLMALATSKLAPHEYAAAFNQYVQAGMAANF